MILTLLGKEQIMKFIHPVLLSFYIIAMIFADSSWAKNLTSEFDKKHKLCLEQISKEASMAFERAMIWQDEGGGRRAKHCVAMSLFALGHEVEAAARLDALAIASDGGTNAMRANFYSEAANFWLIGGHPENAYSSASKGLELVNGSVPLFITRARSYFALKRYGDAIMDLDSALINEPENADALRYRANVNLKQGNFNAAKKDINKSLQINPNSIESALVRGQINESLRLIGSYKKDS
jgi:tetratricopeptide (TPR) repeat protein